MTTPEILAVLRTPLSQLPEVPRAAVAAAAEPARRDEVVPPLLESLRQAVEAAASGDAQHPFWTSPEHHLSLCALALLGQFRERAAAPLVRRLSSIPDSEVALQVWNDVWSPTVFLAATHDGNLAALQAIADDPELSDFDRVDALRAQAALAIWGELDPGEVIQTLTAFFHRERPRGNSSLLALWLELYQDLDLHGLDREIDAAWNDGEIERFMIKWRGPSAAAAAAHDDLARLRNANPELFPPITDAAALLEELPYGEDLTGAAPPAPLSPDHPAVTGPPEDLLTAEVLAYLGLPPEELPALPRRALAAAAEPGRREEIVPPLLRSLQEAVEAVDSGDEEHPFWDSPAFWRSLFALPLLAQFRERRAAPLVRRLAAIRDRDTWETFWGDTFNGRLLAATHDGDTAALAALAADSGLDEFARAGALNALACLGIWGELDPDELTRYLTEFFHRERPRANPLLLALWLGPYQDLGLHELDSEIDAAWNNGEIDRTITGWGGVPPAGEPPSPVDWTRLPRERPADYAPVTDAAEELRWVTFGPRRDEAFAAGNDFSPELDDPPQPIVTGPKTGRNDPCPCGSGKKYKRCCGA